MSFGLIFAILVGTLVILSALYVRYWQIPEKPNDGIAATVNGKEISMETLDQYVREASSELIDEGIDPKTSEGLQEARKKVLQELIDHTLLLEFSTKTQKPIPDTIVENTYQEAVASYGGETEAIRILAEKGVTLEMLRARLKDQLTIAQYLSSEIPEQNYRATDEELGAFYATYVVSVVTNPPPFENLAESIRVQVEQEKFAALYKSYVRQLRESASIDIRI